ncbi:hypothetical protein [Tepidibacillus sp. HK-1]|uniref:5'-methylthioadenosine/S-adenosylhomocysteine nucleosidase family protein n=1 Tax=Tepidibacillus sp. HK-1 TaxID=1883407 RepID=UPI0008529373|nr:hypothetical protein [Tepidibacillus sp. HK-1]GBF10912.1 5'-methylthioadenosine/S-adenosylhomocysteine nucleosidase [Tepidibacillus sp. HK-1]
MIFIVNALYPEAKPLIEYFQLKKVSQISRIQLYENNGIVLAVSGVGITSSAIATTYLLTKYEVKATDTILNIGVAGAKSQKLQGDLIYCHKIIHHDTKYNYYPDILVQHSFSEGVLETFSTIVDLSMSKEVIGDLVDMEGAGFFEAASTFLPPHQIHILKIISDQLQPNEITSLDVSQLMRNQMESIAAFIKKLQEISFTDPEVLTEEDLQLLQQLRDHLHLTITMYHQLIHLTKQYKIRTKEPLDLLQAYLRVEIKTKSEGKSNFEQIRKQLLYT